jgi:hypothetical protein
MVILNLERYGKGKMIYTDCFWAICLAIVLTTVVALSTMLVHMVEMTQEVTLHKGYELRI